MRFRNGHPSGEIHSAGEGLNESCVESGSSREGHPLGKGSTRVPWEVISKRKERKMRKKSRDTLSKVSH
jgi:hypothetical protein